MEWKRKRLACCVSFFFFSIFALFFSSSSSTTTSLEISCTLSGKADLHFQGFENQNEIIKGSSLALARRFLGGPGSSPPRCSSKCGKCTPCKPVHVPVPPGTPVTAEYYPEAWRCKCGNKLYMP
ncbi:hypothetical protein Tsubulata_025753 [Turnera subulata]|uniref:Epidermal patterning factor-like protein n=1 Tax=Turnera subulata TaxID=218843 RepID=A0A9Q0JLA9_9ROSI|nr:hypothetical protein Tsubulata_050448 [Turnera subulata]KAJ4845908.1 hypothetical protein Tsubulata_025753 [Turnera subulata]